MSRILITKNLLSTLITKRKVMFNVFSTTLSFYLQIADIDIMAASYIFVFVHVVFEYRKRASFFFDPFLDIVQYCSVYI